MSNASGEIPPVIQQTLDDFVAAARQAFGDDLRSVVLFGSAAEGRLRASSDVNLLLVLSRYTREQADRIRESYRSAHAAIQLDVMFLLEGEINDACESFAVKFNDIVSRHRVLFGSDPFERQSISREATLRRLRQVLLNLRLRLRERYALVSLREEQLAPIIADYAGPIRASAATLLRLEGKSVSSPKEALALFTADLPGGPWQTVLDHISEARENLLIAPGTAPGVLFQLMELTARLEEFAARLERK